MKKVIIAIPYLRGNGGTETVIKNFAQALDVRGTKNGISWKLISFGGTKYPEWLDGWNKKIYYFSQLKFIQILAYILVMPFLIANILKNENPDYFIATNPIIWSIAYYEKRLFSNTTKIGAWYHYSFKMKHIKKKYLKNPDFFWAISSGIKSELISMGIPSKKIFVIYNPVNINKVKLVKRSGKQNHFIYIGRIDYDGQKNVSELIRAFNHLNGNWHCNLYGSIDKKTKKRLLNLANDNTKNNISFKGFYTNIWGHIRKADALILTSKYEGFPMVLIEAAARGIILISSECPMGPSDIINKNNGFLYKPGDLKQLTSILKNFIYSKKIRSLNSKEISDSVKKFSYEEYAKKILFSLSRVV